MSVKEIARVVGVAPSSVSLWVRDIPLTREQLESLRQRNPAYNRQLRGATRNAERGRARRLDYQEEGRALARAAAPLHVAGTMLYWAEGDKGSKHCARLSNSDSELVALFATFLRAHFAVRDDQLRVTCHLFADHVERQTQIEQYWLDAVQLPRSCLCKSFVNVYSKYSQKKRRNKLPYGTARVCVHSTRVVQSIYGAIQELRRFRAPGVARMTAVRPP